MKKLKRIIKKNWNIKYKTIDKDQSLLELATKIACDSEKCTIEEAYNMFIGNETLHLPGLIAFFIIEEIGLDSSKINSSMTLRSIFNL